MKNEQSSITLSREYIKELLYSATTQLDRPTHLLFGALNGDAKHDVESVRSDLYFAQMNAEAAMETADHWLLDHGPDQEIIRVYGALEESWQASFEI